MYENIKMCTRYEFYETYKSGKNIHTNNKKHGRMHNLKY